MLNRVFSILGAQWLIHQDTAIAYLPVLMAFMKGQDFLLKQVDDKLPNIAAKSQPAQSVSLVGKYDLTDPSIPDNSVALLAIDGPLLSWQSIELMNQLRRVQANDQINSIVLMVNSPGGMVTGLDLLCSTIKTLGKPSVALVTGMAASAAMWIISSTSYRIATSKIDMIGSIGTKTSIQDYSGLLEKIGIKITDFYASKATRKDEQSRAFKENQDTQPMMEIVDFINEVFHQAIIENLGISPDSEALTGAVFFAEKALNLGLINEITSVDAAIEKAYQLGLKNKIIVSSKSLNF